MSMLANGEACTYKLLNTFFRAGSSLRSSSSTTWEIGSAWSAAMGWSRSSWTDFLHFSFIVFPQLFFLIFLLNYFIGRLCLRRVHLEGRVVWRSALLCWLQGVGGLQKNNNNNNNINDDDNTNSNDNNSNANNSSDSRKEWSSTCVTLLNHLKSFGVEHEASEFI